MASQGLDRRRINGPEESHLPVFEEDLVDAKVDAGSRKGRLPADIRPIFLQPGLIDQANGSAYIETEKTKIACAVYGPRQSKNQAYSEKGKLNVEVKYAPFSSRQRKIPNHDADDRALAVAIHQALLPAVRLELFPKSTIDIFITVIEADGMEGCIASGANAASTALADAGIEMVGMVISCSAAVLKQDIWLDPTEDEARVSQGTLIVSCMPALDTITSIWQSGQMEVDESLLCIESCQKRCIDIHAVLSHALIERNSAS